MQNAFGSRFTIIESVAAGGQGAVFRAQTSDDFSQVALKVYFEDQIEERTRREIVALESITGDTIVKLVSEGRCELRGQPCIFIATSYIAGDTLAAFIGRGPVEPGVAARIGADIALAVGLLWAKRIVHRDIKPSNIMITSAGRAVLIDLGLARHLGLSPLTSVGKTWGTEGYLSPEQAKGSLLSCKSDVFALGIVLQESLLGRHPTSRRQLPLLEGGPRTSGLRAGLPAGLVTVIDALVHKSPLRRPLPQEAANALLSLASLQR
jgi:serine/threonine protein kinase